MRFEHICCEDVYGYLHFDDGRVIKVDIYDENTQSDNWTVELLDKSPHYAKVRNEKGHWVGFAGEYGKQSFKERCENALFDYPHRHSTFYNSLLKQFEQKGKLSPKQLEVLEKEIQQKLSVS